MQSGRHLIARALAGLALAGVAVGGFPAAAPAAEPTRAELEERIRRLESIIEKHGLDRPEERRAAPAPAAEAPAIDQSRVEAIVDEKIEKQKVLAGWKDGFFLESPSGDFKLKIRGYVQADTRAFPNNGGDTGFNDFTLRRVRPIVEGTVYRWFDYRIMPDFGGGATSLQDAYGEVKHWAFAKFRAGKFKQPVSLERLQSGTDLLFVERSIANGLAPNRDVGFQLAGELWDGILGYQIGVFNGTLDGGSVDNDVSSEKELAGRIFAHPAKNSGIPALAGLGIGVAGTCGDLSNADNLADLRYRTPARSTFFRFDISGDVSIRADDERHRIVPQGYWYGGPLGAMGEYVFSKQGVRRQDDATGEVTRVDLDNAGWFAQVSYVLTGENASYKGVAPINDFDPRNGRWGAFEVAARGSQVKIDDDAFDFGLASRPRSTSEAWNWGVGVNWYLNRHFEFNLNFERTEFDTPVSFDGTLRDKEDVVLTRFQVTY